MEINLYAMEPAAIFCTNANVMMFFDTPKGNYFLGALRRVGNAKTAEFIDQSVADLADPDHYNRTPDGELSNGIIAVPFNKTSLPADTPRGVFLVKP